MDYLLSICIPTHNRKKFLQYNIEKFIKLRKKYNFEVCVSDNASKDDTDAYMQSVVAKYNFIKYFKHEINRGAAANCDFVLNMGNGKYRWLLGDDDEIFEEGLSFLLEICKERSENFIVVSGYRYCEHEKNNFMLLDDKNKILENLGYNMGWMSTLIFSKNILNKVDFSNFSYNAYPHLINIFRLLNCQCSLLYVNVKAVLPQNNSYMGYSDRYIRYTIKDWYLVADEIGEYSVEAKQVFRNSMIEVEYNFKRILKLRIDGILTLKSIIEVKDILLKQNLLLVLKLFFGLMFPKKTINFIYYKVYKKIK